MAEAFGVAAGIITVIESSAKVIKVCKHLIETAHDAPRDLCHIFIEISSLNAALESLKYLRNSECDVSDLLRQLDVDNGAIAGCRDTIEELEAELNGLSLSPREGSQKGPGKKERVKGSLQWCLKESKAMKLLDQVLQYKSTIMLTLVGEVT
jgi:hypothetical protein